MSTTPPTDSAPSTPDSALTTADAPLATDLPCMRCDYNLRTKRPSELCPECGHPIALSIAARNAIMRNPRRAALGAFLLATACFSLVTVGLLGRLASALEMPSTPLLGLLIVLTLLSGSFICVGILLLRLGAMRPTSPFSNTFPVFFAIAVIVFIALPVTGGALHTFHGPFVVPPSLPWPLFIGLAELILLLPIFIVGRWYLAR